MSTLRKSIIHTTKDIFDGFGKHGVMTHAAAIAFYTIFSLPGLLITIVMVAGVFFGQEAVSGELANNIDQLVGRKAAETVQSILKNIELEGSSNLGTVIGIGTLLFSATTVFISLQDALNTIWDVKAKPTKGWLKYIINRAISFGMIISLGFILLVSLLVDTFLEIFMEKLEDIVGVNNGLMLNIISFIVSVTIIFVIIGLIFKLLPDIKVSWKNIAIGALITAGLFILGKFLIGLYLGRSNFSKTYEAAGSFIIILIWVYYSAVILLFGAEITRALMNYNHQPIEPCETAVKTKTEEKEVSK